MLNASITDLSQSQSQLLTVRQGLPQYTETLNCDSAFVVLNSYPHFWLEPCSQLVSPGIIASIPEHGRL